MIVIANWKSNKTRDQSVKWMDKFAELVKIPAALNKLESTTIVIAPPLPHLMFVSNRLLDRQIFATTYLGIQDISQYPAGSYTGAVSGITLDGYNVKYAILGHSERRKYFYETSLDVAKKVEQCLENGITPIICVDRNEFQNQVDELDKKTLAKLIIAYEPVSHIGTGVGEDAGEVETVMNELENIFPESKLIYGGSVNRDNVSNYLHIKQIQGFLVGTASLDVEEFVEIILSTI